MSVLRKLFRLGLVCWDFAYSVLEVLVTRPRSRAARAAWLGKLCRRVMRTLDITFHTVGEVPSTGAIISNHLTFVDIFMHSFIHPCVFVSKIELRSVPLLGWMSMMAGTVYVSRGAGGSAAKAGQDMEKGFRDGLPVVFFPEGTTGMEQNHVLPLRSGLLAQVLALKQPIVPAFIRYELSPIDIAEGKTLEQNFFWGAQTLPQIIWQLVGFHAIHATVTFGPAIAFSEKALANRKVAAIEAHAAMLSLATPSAHASPAVSHEN